MRGGHQEEDDAGWVDEIDDDFDADALENEVSDGPSDENDMDWEDELPLEDEWDEGDAWAEWLEVEEDGFSESSEEDVEGEKAANELAAATSTRFVENGAVSYCVPTAHFHFQSADALSLATEYNSDDGSILLTTLDRHGVAAWLVPSSAKAAGMGLGAPQNAHRLGGFQHPSDIFSMTCSPDGRYIITGGGSGILSIYTVDPSAPPRPPGSRDNAAMSGVTYFYTPIIAPLDVGPTNSPHFVEMFMHHQHQEQQQQQGDDEELREQQPARAAMTGGEENDANAHSTPGCPLDNARKGRLAWRFAKRCLSSSS